MSFIALGRPPEEDSNRFSMPSLSAKAMTFDLRSDTRYTSSQMSVCALCQNEDQMRRVHRVGKESADVKGG